ncbi:MAG: LexA family transcriptional regulator [Nitrospinales bacterium]
MNYSQKLKTARVQNGLSQVELARLMVERGRKVTSQQVSSWERGDYQPAQKNLIALCEALKINLTYFQDSGSREAPSLIGHAESDLPEEFSLVEKKKGAISAGVGLSPSEEVDFRLAFRNEWLEKFGGAEQLFVMRVEGDSMEPTLNENDIVLINKNASTVGPGGGIFAVNWDGLILVKRLQLNLETKELILKSDNSKYSSSVMSPDKIKIEGRVIWYGRELR